MRIHRTIVFSAPKRVFRKIDVFLKGLEGCLSSVAFVIESKILKDVSSAYGTFSETRFERKPEEYDFASQIKSTMPRA